MEIPEGYYPLIYDREGSPYLSVIKHNPRVAEWTVDEMNGAYLLSFWWENRDESYEDIKYFPAEHYAFAQEEDALAFVRAQTVEKGDDDWVLQDNLEVWDFSRAEIYEPGCEVEFYVLDLNAVRLPPGCRMVGRWRDEHATD
jgi:hypothetical protein